MIRLPLSRILLQYNRNVIQAIAARYSIDTATKERIDKLVKDKKVVVFMKGTADEPSCGFSRAVVQMLKFHGVNFDSHNVLADDSLRQGIKEYSNWPTIPQVFIGGEFIGGCDVMLEMHKSGELIEEFKKVGIISSLVYKSDQNKVTDK